MKTAVAKSKLSEEKILPGSRLTIEKQISILKAFVAFYEKTKVGASYSEIAPIVNISGANVSGILKFWRSINMLETDNNKNQPSKVLVEIIRNIQWGDHESGWSIFRTAVRDSWFVSHLTMSFRIKATMKYDDVINSLGIASGSTKRDKNMTASLRNLVELLELTGILSKDESNIFQLTELESHKMPISVDQEKDLLQVRIGDEIYAIDTETLKEYIKKNGKKLDSNLQHIV